MPVEWFVQRKTGVSGPYTAAQLKTLAEEGKVTASDLIRKGMDGNPVPASRVKGLFDVAEQAKPSPPPPPIADAMPVGWFVRLNGQETGPHSGRELKSLAKAGILTTASEVKQGVGGQWTSAKNLHGLDLPQVAKPLKTVEQFPATTTMGNRSSSNNSNKLAALLAFCALVFVVVVAISRNVPAPSPDHSEPSANLPRRETPSPLVSMPQSDRVAFSPQPKPKMSDGERALLLEKLRDTKRAREIVQDSIRKLEEQKGNAAIIGKSGLELWELEMRRGIDGEKALTNEIERLEQEIANN
jgi:hypothetical protein